MNSKQLFRLVFILIFLIYLTYVIMFYMSLSENNSIRDYPYLRTKTIDALVNKYKVDYNYTMKEHPWTVAQRWVTGRHVHPEFTPSLGAVLHALTTKKIIYADVLSGGTYIKLLVHLEGGQRAVIRPKVAEIDFIEYGLIDGVDRHNGEIAAYHLGRILEFRRAPHIIGRHVNIETEILPVATKNLTRMIKQQDGNFYISKRARTKNKPPWIVNADGNMLEGSIALWLSSPLMYKRYPWKLSRNGTVMPWEYDNFCKEAILTQPFYTKGPLLMDIIDTSIFDFLIGNTDRHTIRILTIGEESMFAMTDNAKAFNNPWFNTELLPVLSALTQCCRVRESTWNRLLYLDDILGDVLKHVIAQDPLAPLLYQDHFDGLNRRLKTVTKCIQFCISSFGETNVLVSDK